MLLESKRSDASYTFSRTVEVSRSAGSQGRTSSQWIRFTLTCERVNVSLRLAAAWRTKQTGYLMGDTEQSVALDFCVGLKSAYRQLWSPIDKQRDAGFSKTGWCDLTRKEKADNNWKALTVNLLTIWLTKHPVGSKYTGKITTEIVFKFRVQRVMQV